MRYTPGAKPRVWQAGRERARESERARERESERESERERARGGRETTGYEPFEREREREVDLVSDFGWTSQKALSSVRYTPGEHAMLRFEPFEHPWERPYRMVLGTCGVFAQSISGLGGVGGRDLEEGTLVREVHPRREAHPRKPYPPVRKVATLKTSMYHTSLDRGT